VIRKGDFTGKFYIILKGKVQVLDLENSQNPPHKKVILEEELLNYNPNEEQVKIKVLG